MLKALLILIFFTLTLTEVFAWSPKTIEYRKSFDEVGKIQLSQKMSMKDFETVTEDYMSLGDEWLCHTTLKIKDKNLGVLFAGGFNFELKEVVTTSPYSYCKRLPDFQAHADSDRGDSWHQTITLKYEDSDGTKISVKLYGKSRAVIYDYSTKKTYKAKVTSNF